MISSNVSWSKHLIHRIQDIERNCGSEKDSVIGCLPGSHNKEIEYKNVKPVAVIDMAWVPATLCPRIKAELDRMESIDESARLMSVGILRGTSRETR
jgi:hypothetical protein